MRRKLSMAILAATVAGSDLYADSHRLQSDFTFRRIGVPQAGTANRIDVQISPAAPGGPSAPPAAGQGGAPTSPRAPGSPAIAGLAPAAGPLDWFWQVVSPSMDASSPASFVAAQTALLNATPDQSVPQPRLQAMSELAERYGIDILAATVGKDVSPALVLAVISVESAGQSDAVSHAGARGLMQLMPATAQRFGVSDSLDARQNIEGGVAYLHWLLAEFDRDLIMALAGYNAGEGAVRDNNGVPPYAETRAYVPKVIAAWQVARGLCITPPELPTDGCVFNVMGE